MSLHTALQIAKRTSLRAARRIFFDTETYSPIDLVRSGVHRYAERVEIMIAAYAIDDGPIRVWDCTAVHAMPDELVDAFNSETIEWVMHNAQFDRTCVAHDWGLDIPAERTVCTAARAYQHGLPGGLARLSEIFRLGDDGKDTRGKELIRLFCMPQKRGAITRATRLTHPVEWTTFLEYAGQDIVAMRALLAKLPAWNDTPRERALFALDAKINTRGFAVDVELVGAAIEAAAIEKRRLATRTRDLTDGAVESATQRAALLDYFKTEHGESLPDMRAPTLERRLQDDAVPWQVRELIALRLQSSMTSVAKFDALAKCVSSDGRLRGTTQYCGAARTGRWAGRLFQPQNLTRTPREWAKRLDVAIRALKAGVPEYVTTNVMELISACARSAIVAAPGKKLVVADLRNIEGRMLAWLAGEEWKLQAYRDFDAGTGPDLYVLSYARAFNVSPESVIADEAAGGNWRLIGKVAELACGYQGAVGAFASMAALYRFPLYDEARVDEVLARAYAAGRVPQEGDRAAVIELLTVDRVLPLVRAWREANPKIVRLWYDTEDAARETILTGRPTSAGRLRFTLAGAWLRMHLPSGRVLCYPSPRVDAEGKLSFVGINPYTRQFERLGTFGGRLVENACQGASRDVLAESMPAIDQAGYEIVLTVHDELVTEAANDPYFNATDLCTRMTARVQWAPGLPLAAAGYESPYYKKG
ncbi:MAG: DNA polymerase I [Polynucleobacter sp.]